MDNFALGAPAHQLLLVEDDQELASLIREFLIKNGFEVSHVTNGLQAVAQIQQQSPDLVILDVMLPGLSGMEVCKQVRMFFQKPILMLTALDEDMDQMLGLELGADDYVIKPVKPRLLLSRIRALLRRAEVGHQPLSSDITPQADFASSALLEINLQMRSVLYCQQSILLTTAEFDLLALLAEYSGQTVSREWIIQSLRGFEYDGMDRSIDRRISRLRKKLGDETTEPEVIKTVRGKGYLLCVKVVLNDA